MSIVKQKWKIIAFLLIFIFLSNFNSIKVNADENQHVNVDAIIEDMEHRLNGITGETCATFVSVSNGWASSAGLSLEFSSLNSGGTYVRNQYYGDVDSAFGILDEVVGNYEFDDGTHYIASDDVVVAKGWIAFKVNDKLGYRLYPKYSELALEYRNDVYSNASGWTNAFGTFWDKDKGGTNVFNTPSPTQPVSLGMWLYRNSDEQFDQIQRNKMDGLQLAIVNNENNDIDGKTGFLYNELLFCWPIANKGSGITLNDTFASKYHISYQTLVNAIANHDIDDFSGISDSGKSSVVWFQGSMYTSTGSNWAGGYRITIPKSSEVVQRIANENNGADFSSWKNSKGKGFESYVGGGVGAGSKTHSLKHLLNDGASVTTHNTYRKGKIYHPSFININGTYYGPRTIYACEISNLGQQIQNNYGFANDGGFSSVGDKVSDRIYSVYHYWANGGHKFWGKSKYYSSREEIVAKAIRAAYSSSVGKRYDKTIFDISTTIQVAYATTPGFAYSVMDYLLKYKGEEDYNGINESLRKLADELGVSSDFSRKIDNAGANINKTIWENAGLSKGTKWSKENEKKLFDALNEYSMERPEEMTIYYYWVAEKILGTDESGNDNKQNQSLIFSITGFASQLNSTQIGCIRDSGFYYHFLTMGYDLEPVGPKAKMDKDDLEVFVVDLFNAFDLNSNQKELIRQGAMNNGASGAYSAALGCLNNDQRKASTIAAAFNKENQVTYQNDSLLTTTEIEKGKIEASADSLDAGYVPYVVVVKQSQKDYFAINKVSDFTFSNVESGYQKMQTISSLRKTNGQVKDKTYDEAMQKFGSLYFYEQFADFEPNPYVDVLISFGKDNATKEASKEIDISTFYGESTKDKDKYANVSQAFGLAGKSLSTTINTNNSRIAANQNVYQKDFILLSGKQSGIAAKFIRIPYRKSTVDLRGSSASSYVAASSALLTLDGTPTVNLRTSLEDEYARYFMASFSIDSFGAEYKNGKLLHNKFGTNTAEAIYLDAYGKDVATKLSGNGISNSDTKNAHIYAMMGGVSEDVTTKNGTKRYSIAEPSVYLWANSHNGTFGNLLKKIFKNEKYTSFASGKQTISIKITNKAVTNYGFNGSLASLQMTEPEVQSLNDELNAFARDFNLNGIIGQSGFQSLDTDYSAEKLAAIISCIFDENEIVEASYEVVAESEDLLISNSHQDATTVKTGSKDSLNRKTIDWFQGGESQFDFTCTMTNDLVNGSSAIDGTYTTGGKWMLKKDTSAKDLNSKTILYGRNTNSNPRIDTGRVIKGYIYAGRIPEATRSGLKVSDYTVRIVEDFYTDGSGVSDEEFSGADYRKVLEQLYTNANTTDARRSALDSMHHAYANGVLYKAFKSQTVLNNIKVTPSKIISVSNANVSKPAGGKIGNGSLGKVETSYNANQAWAPGMVVKYYYEYYLPQGSQSSWILYIQSKVGDTYARTFDKTQMSSISSVLLKFVLAPSNIDDSSRLSIFDKNIRNNSLYLGTEISDGGNFYWADDQVPTAQFNGTSIEGTWDSVSSTLTLQIPEALENGTIDSNGVLLRDVKVTLLPTLQWDSLLFGNGGTPFHTKAQQGIYADLAGMQGIATSRINQTTMLSQLYPTDGINQGIGTDRIVSPFKTRYIYNVTIPRGTVIMSKRETPTIDLWVPGSKHRDSTACGGNEINCTSDNSITKDRDCIHVAFEGVGTPRDNKIVDIVLSANNVPGYNTTTQILAIGKNNYNVFDGSEQDAQSIVYYDSSKNAKVMPSNLRVTALVERGSLPSGYNSSKMSIECRPNEINQYIKMYWCLSYSDAGRPFNTSALGTTSDWAELNGARLVGNNQTRNFVYPDGGASINFTTKVTGGQQYPIMCNVGDRLAWEYDITGQSISSLSVSCGYRIQGDAFDNMDIDLNNNQRTEKWESVIDVVAKTVSVPNTILTGTTTIQCNNVKVDVPHSKNAVYNTTHTLSTFMEGIELTNKGSNVFDLSWIGGTVQIYAKQGSSTYYPSRITCNASGDVGTYSKGKNGKFHIYALTPDITINAEWTGCTFQPGEVDWYIEFWPWVDNLGPNGYVNAQYATNLRSGIIPGSDVGQSSSLSIETIPWKGSGISTNNRDYSETPVVQHSNVINETPNPYCICKQKKYKFLANEVRWTDRFKWYNHQFAIADWHTLNPSAAVEYGTYRLSSLRFGGSTTFGSGTGAYGIGTFYDRVSDNGDVYKGKTNHEGCGTGGAGGGNSPSGVSAPNNQAGPGGLQHAGTDLQYTSMNLYYWHNDIANVSVIDGHHEHQHFKTVGSGKDAHSEYSHSTYDTRYKWEIHYYRGNRTLEPTLSYSTSSCRTYVGPDQSTFNWGPNGMTDGENIGFSEYLPTSKGATEAQFDEVGFRSGGSQTFGTKNNLKLPTKYFNYIYKAGTITNNKLGASNQGAPATHGNLTDGVTLTDKTVGNWDSLSMSDITSDADTPGRTKYNFFAEKIQVSFLIYTSRTDGKLGTPVQLSGAESNSYKVYNGESFKVHVRVTYACNRTNYHLPASPIQNIPYPQSGSTNVVQSVRSGQRRASLIIRNSGGSGIKMPNMGTKNDGIYFKTATVAAGKYIGHYAEYVWADLNEHDHVSTDSKFIKKSGGKTPTTPVIGGGVMGGMFSYSGTDCIFENNPTQRTWDGKAIQSTWLSDTWSSGSARVQYWHLNQNRIDTASNVRQNVTSLSGAYNVGGYGLIVYNDMGSSLGSMGHQTYVTRMAYNNLLESYPSRSWHRIDNHQGTYNPSTSPNRFYFKYFAEKGVLSVAKSVSMSCNDLGIMNTGTGGNRFNYVTANKVLIFTIKGSKDYSGTFKANPGKTSTSTSPNYKFTYDYYVFPVNTTGTDSIDIPHNNEKQDIYIYAESFPIMGMAAAPVDGYSGMGGHPYYGFAGELGNAYLCDRSMLHIEILPTTAIIGTDTEIPSGLDGEITSDTVTSPDTYVY